MESGCCSCPKHLLLPSMSAPMKSTHAGHTNTRGLSKSTVSAAKMTLLTVIVLVIGIIGDSARVAEAAAASSRSGKSI